VVQAGLLDGPGTELTARLGVARRQRAEVHEGHAVMLVVVGHEAEVRVLPDDVTTEHRRVPVAHVGEAVGLIDDVSELGGGMVLLLHDPHVGCYGNRVEGATA
jgi:hypothetical protein